MNAVVAMCAIPGCSGKVRARGWCDKHWQRWKRHGDPLAQRQNSPIPVSLESNDAWLLACHIDFPQYVVRSDGILISIVNPRRPLALHGGMAGKYVAFRILNRDLSYRPIYCHTLVCETFHGARPDGQEVRHKDGASTHNWAENLQWGTRSQNMHDKELHGTALIGERHNMAKLTDQDVRDIRLLAECGAPPWLPMRHYNISRMQHWRIVNRKNWTHI